MKKIELDIWDVMEDLERVEPKYPEFWDDFHKFIKNPKHKQKFKLKKGQKVVGKTIQDA